MRTPMNSILPFPSPLDASSIKSGWRNMALDQWYFSPGPYFLAACFCSRTALPVRSWVGRAGCSQDPSPVLTSPGAILFKITLTSLTFARVLASGNWYASVLLTVGERLRSAWLCVHLMLSLCPFDSRLQFCATEIPASTSFK